MVILKLWTATSAAGAVLFHCCLSLIQSGHILFGSSTKLCGRLVCWLRAAESSPATLVASQLLPPGQLTPSSIQRRDQGEETVDPLHINDARAVKSCWNILNTSVRVSALMLCPMIEVLTRPDTVRPACLLRKKDSSAFCCWSLLWLSGLYAMMKCRPAGYSGLIKEQRSEVSFNEALKRGPTTHAYPLSSISGASGGICKPFDKHP